MTATVGDEEAVMGVSVESKTNDSSGASPADNADPWGEAIIEG